MRLSDEEIKQYRLSVNMPTCWKDDGNCRECSNLPMCNLVNKLLGTIEALQQENNGLKWHSRLFKDFCKLQQENSSLKAQANKLKKALDNMYFAYINKCDDCPHDFELDALEQYKVICANFPENKDNCFNTGTISQVIEETRAKSKEV